MEVSIKCGPLITGTLGITDNDTLGIDPITGPDIVPNIASDVSDKTCDIVISYECIPTTEATGCDVGDTVSRLGSVGGVEVTTALEESPNTDDAADCPNKGCECGKKYSTTAAVEGATLGNEPVK